MQNQILDDINWFVLTILNEGAYLTYMFYILQDPQFISIPLWNHSRIRSWNKPVLTNEDTDSWSMNQLEH